MAPNHEKPGAVGKLISARWSWMPDRRLRRILQQRALPRELEQRHTGRRLLRTAQSHYQRKGKDQENDNPKPPLATSKTSCMINHTNEPEPPELKSLWCPILYDDGHLALNRVHQHSQILMIIIINSAQSIKLTYYAKYLNCYYQICTIPQLKFKLSLKILVRSYIRRTHLSSVFGSRYTLPNLPLIIRTNHI